MNTTDRPAEEQKLRESMEALDKSARRFAAAWLEVNIAYVESMRAVLDAFTAAFAAAKAAMTEDEVVGEPDGRNCRGGAAIIARQRHLTNG